MRTVEETLELFKQALHKRRAYVRRRVKEWDVEKEKAQKACRRGRISSRIDGMLSLRSGMLSEHATIRCMLQRIEEGSLHPDEIYNIEDDPKEPC